MWESLEIIVNLFTNLLKKILLLYARTVPHVCIVLHIMTSYQQSRKREPVCRTVWTGYVRLLWNGTVFIPCVWGKSFQHKYIHTLGYSTVPGTYFSRNLSGKCCKIFFVCKTSFGPWTLGPPPRGLGGLAHRRGSAVLRHMTDCLRTPYVCVHTGGGFLSGQKYILWANSPFYKGD